MQTSLWLTAVGFAALLSSNALAAPHASSADATLSRNERGALLAGEVVARPMQFETDNGSYRGGVSYSLVNAPAAAVLAALSNVDTLPQALPHTKSARLIDVRGSLARVQLVHGDGTTYTVHIERSAPRSPRLAIPDGGELRFWLDSSRPHDISDVFGFFRVEPFSGRQEPGDGGRSARPGPGHHQSSCLARLSNAACSAPRVEYEFTSSRGRSPCWKRRAGRSGFELAKAAQVCSNCGQPHARPD